VRHPEHEYFLEEDWFFEAITETYIPLINVFTGLVNDGVDFRITMSVTPTLISMMTDSLLQERYVRHLNKLIELSRKEMERTKWQPEFNSLAVMYNHRFTQARSVFCDRYHNDLTKAFKEFQDKGYLELITCGATHGFFPNMDIEKKAVKAQARVGADLHEKVFGKRPAGIWLPECGYNPGDDEILRDAGIKYFIIDTHGILFGSPRPKFGIFAPVYCKSGVAAFGRDVETSKSVWSAKEGYPGDYNYREFYRDIGYDLEYDYIRPYITPDGTRINTGIKYFKISGSESHKEPYDPGRALDKAAEHAGNFLFNREKQVEYLSSVMDREPIIVAPYDAELFGHWWFEGPDWINYLLRKMHFDQDTVKTINPGEYLRKYPKNQVITPSFSSWGYKGYAEVWLEGSNDWIYRHLHKSTERMIEAASQNSDGTSQKQKRALNQMARELLLAQSSDWAFIMKTGTHVEYAHKRTKDHIERFTKLYFQVKQNSIDQSYLEQIESKDNIFPDIDYRIYA
jgi:1,4-alpha-glucan branching enzyme